MKNYVTASVRIGFICLFFIGIVFHADSGIAGKIKLGFVSDISGPGFLIALAQKSALEIGIEEINSSGGLLGETVELLIRDSKIKPKWGSQLARELILNDKVHFLIGPTSPAVALAVSKVCKEYKKLIFFPGANIERITLEQGHRYQFQVIPNTFMEGQSAANFINSKSFQKVAIIGPNLEYGRSMAAAFKKRLLELNPSIQILKELWPKVGETNFIPYLHVLIESQPDVIFSILWAGDLGTFIRQASVPGLFQKTAFLGLFDYDLLKGLGQEIPLNLFGFDRAPFYAIENSQMKKFIEKFKAKTGDYPSSWAIMGYDGLMALKKAVEKANSLDTEKVINALEGLQWESLRGPLFVRPSNHIANGGLYFGVTYKNPKYPFITMKDVIYISGQEVWHTKEDIEALRK